MTTDSKDDVEPVDGRPEPAAEAAPTPTPEDPPGPSRTRRLVEVAIVAGVVLALDLWSKAWAWDNLRDGQVVTVIENWFYFEFGFNTGSAFSFLKDASYARVTFIAVTIVALAYMGRLAMTLPTRYGTAFVAVACVIGGALGNLHDRLVRVMELRGEPRHGVVDFIKVYYWPDKVWPTFNVADIALVVGVGLLFIFLTRHGEALDPPKNEGENENEGEPKP
jgi:signal peptidase II